MPIAEWLRSAALIALIAIGTTLCLLLTRPFLPGLGQPSVAGGMAIQTHLESGRLDTLALVAIWNERARAQPNGCADRPGGA